MINNRKIGIRNMENRYLYRAKRLDDGKWIQGYLYGIWERIYILWGMCNDVPCMIEVDPATVCQCTGLEDKNGKLIFENDICSRKESHPEIVKYHEGDWILDYSYVSGKEYGYNWCNLGFYVFERPCVEVIGNVFDDKELLN